MSYIKGEVYGAPYNRVLALVYQGEDAIAKLRKISGATNPEEADSISIRGSYGRITTKGVYENVIHCSSDPDEAKREIQLWFLPEELVEKLYPTKTVTHEKVQATVWA